jgi:hypothetical protein
MAAANPGGRVAQIDPEQVLLPGHQGREPLFRVSKAPALNTPWQGESKSVGTLVDDG